MITIDRVAEVRALLDAERAKGRRVGVVGTSGALHEGHVSLVRRAKAENDVVVLFWHGALKLEWAPDTIQVYKRDLARDSAVVEPAGVDIVFVPMREDMYRRPSVTFLQQPAMLAHLDGMPEGVGMDILVTMVGTLLNIAGPCRTYFGEKDWQQLVLFQRMAEDLLLPSQVLACPTVREPDGVAMSSRNARLSAADRAAAPAVYRALRAAVEAVEAGERDAGAVVKLVTDLISPVASVNYVVPVEADSLRPLDTLAGAVRLLVSATFGATPLVDNIGVTVTP